MGGNGRVREGTLQSTQLRRNWMSALCIHCRRTAAPQCAPTNVYLKKKTLLPENNRLQLHGPDGRGSLVGL